MSEKIVSRLALITAILAFLAAVVALAPSAINWWDESKIARVEEQSFIS